MNNDNLLPLNNENLPIPNDDNLPPPEDDYVPPLHVRRVRSHQDQPTTHLHKITKDLTVLISTEPRPYTTRVWRSPVKITSVQDFHFPERPVSSSFLKPYFCCSPIPGIIKGPCWMNPQSKHVRLPIPAPMSIILAEPQAIHLSSKRRIGG
jgi:hypothetical protein